MNGHVFECFDEQRDRKQFKKTLEALDEYAKKSVRYPEDLAPLFTDTIKTPMLDEPEELESTASKLEELIWNEQVKEFVKRSRELRSNLATMYAVAWGQCSPAMRAKIKSLDGYEERMSGNDCAWLLQQVRAVTLQFDAKRNPFLSLLDARASFLTYRQGQQQTPESYLATMRGWAETIESYGGTISEDKELIPKTDEEGNDRDDETRATLARDKTLAIALIRGADPHRYGTLIQELANQFAMGVDNYPNDMTAAYSALVHYKTPSNARERRTDQEQYYRPGGRSHVRTGWACARHKRNTPRRNHMLQLPQERATTQRIAQKIIKTPYRSFSVRSRKLHIIMPAFRGLGFYWTRSRRYPCLTILTWSAISNQVIILCASKQTAVSKTPPCRPCSGTLVVCGITRGQSPTSFRWLKFVKFVALLWTPASNPRCASTVRTGPS